MGNSQSWGMPSSLAFHLAVIAHCVVCHLLTVLCARSSAPGTSLECHVCIVGMSTTPILYHSLPRKCCTSSTHIFANLLHYCEPVKKLKIQHSSTLTNFSDFNIMISTNTMTNFKPNHSSMLNNCCCAPLHNYIVFAMLASHNRWTAWTT